MPFSFSNYGDVNMRKISKMSNKTFKRILITECIIGIAITAAHAIYIYYAYQHSSIIQFIARELWFK